CRDGWVDFEGVADGREGVTSVITRDGISTLHPWPWSIAIKRFNPWAVGVPSPTLGIPPMIATAIRDASRRILLSGPWASISSPLLGSTYERIAVSASFNGCTIIACVIPILVIASVNTDL